MDDAAANRILGRIPKVTPSSKVVGDLALHLAAVKADPDDFAENPQNYDIPDSDARCVPQADRGCTATARGEAGAGQAARNGASRLRAATGAGGSTAAAAKSGNAVHHALIYQSGVLVNTLSNMMKTIADGSIAEHQAAGPVYLQGAVFLNYRYATRLTGSPSCRWCSTFSLSLTARSV
ncbi:hypothetical protein [Mangrovicoccus ximenensis]|uniref:hypothetical protein n=1 Tax=Mangrovicoccus ximenensis TaxID=1911570 RepID=UPI00191BF32A|nr:hypothetical protein [Mangrovicoccus ximenensis]